MQTDGHIQQHDARDPHRFDARLAVVTTLVYSVALFLAQSWVALGVLALGLAGVLLHARVSLAAMARSLVPLFVLLAFTVAVQIPTGIATGLFSAARIVLLVVATLVVAFSYDDTEMVQAFSSLMRPLRALRVPVDDVAMMFSIALRFIPVCMDEFRRVANAQRSRCAPFDDGGLIVRAKAWGNVFVPMIVGMFHRAGVLAQSMEARCYGMTKRTSLHGDCRIDLRQMVGAVCVCAGCLAVGIVL